MRLPRPGLRGKLALSISLVLLVALGITYYAVYRGTGSELQDRTETDLERESESLEARLAGGRADDPEEYVVRARALLRDETFGPNARVISISVPGAGVATNQPGLIEPGLNRGGEGDGEDDDHGGSGGTHEQHEKRENAARILEAKPGFSTVEVDDAGEIRLLTRPVTLPDSVAAKIQVGQPLAPVQSALEGLSDTFLIVGAATLLLGALVGWLLASSAAGPMRRMASVAEGIDDGEISARMPVEGTRDEARRLAESFNGMLDRLEGAFRRQREFVADASHDLRTPLTVVRGQIEVLARDPDPTAEEVGRVAAFVTRAIDRMESLVDDLLLLARAEAVEGLDVEVVDLGPLLEGEVEAVAEGDIEVELGPVTSRTVAIDRAQFSRAVANLIGNAVAHSAGRVEVGAASRGGEVVVTVDDDGPGVPPADRERVFERFARLDLARSSSDGGSGLGLAIVKAIAESHGGRVACSDSPLGGARFEIALPAAGAGGSTQL